MGAGAGRAAAPGRRGARAGAYGSHNPTVVDVLRACGIVYARTTATTGRFDIPTDWLRMPATCKHTDPKLMELARKFADMKVTKDGAKLFYV